MDMAYFEVLRISLAVGGPIALVASFWVGTAVFMSSTINKLISVMGMITLVPFSTTFAYFTGPLLVETAPTLGFVCALGYGMILNWLGCYLIHHSGDTMIDGWKRQVREPTIEQRASSPLLLEAPLQLGGQQQNAPLTRARLRSSVRRP